MGGFCRLTNWWPVSPSRSLHLTSGMDHVMSTFHRSGENAIVVKARRLCRMHNAFAVLHPYLRKTPWRHARCEAKTIKEQPMCHGVEYAGSDALQVPGSPSAIVFYTCRPSSSSSLQSWRCNARRPPPKPRGPPLLPIQVKHSIH